MLLRRVILTLLLFILALPLPALASKTHVVKSKESLQSIARKYHVTTKEIRQANSLSSNQVSKGTKLIIPSRTATAKPVIENCSTYRVKKGDTLAKIAAKTGVEASELKRINGLKKSTPKPGSVLMLADQCELNPNKQNRTGKLELINQDLLTEQELNVTLAELSDINLEGSINLAKSIEEKSDMPSFSNLQKSAYGFLGARYRFGGNSRHALDCSSFTQQVFREHKVNLPRTAREQFRVGQQVTVGDLQRGDLVFFRTYAAFPSHVGIYLGNRKMIHASSGARRVVVSPMDTTYYLSRYLGARRIDKLDPNLLDIQNLLLDVEEENDSDAIKNDFLGIGLQAAEK